MRDHSAVAPVAAAVAATLLMGIGMLGCTGDRARPGALDATGPSGPIQLQAEVLDPQINDILYAGSETTVRVQASEGSGQLSGVGFVVRRVGPEARTLDSAVVDFGAKQDTVVPFPLTIPDTMPHNSLLRFTGLAFGPDTLVTQSQPRTVTVSECPDTGGFC